MEVQGTGSPVLSDVMEQPRWGKQNYDHIIILGVKYQLIFSDSDHYPLLADNDAYCDTSAKLIVVDNMTNVDHNKSKQNLSQYMRQLVRHESLHAALYESGLGGCCDWANREDMVDWIAIQFPKLLKMFESIEVTK